MKFLNPEFIHVEINEYYKFISMTPELQESLPDISILTLEKLDNAIFVAAKIFQEKIKKIKVNLEDPKIGIVSVDIAERSNLTPDENAYWGVVLALSLTANVFRPTRDKLNNTPFTIYAASPKKSQALVELGLGTVAPETKLGFHTDGVIRGNRVSLPRHIMLYNILIEYEVPGNFYWVPFQLWEKKAYFMRQVGIGRKYRINVTPSIYENKEGEMEVVTPREVEVPIFPKNSVENFPLYLNGDIVNDEGVANEDWELIAALRDSIQTNEYRYAVPQKTRRIIFACNTKGAHARDIFEKPLNQGDYTRIFMRAVDENDVSLVD